VHEPTPPIVDALAGLPGAPHARRAPRPTRPRSRGTRSPARLTRPALVAADAVALAAAFVLADQLAAGHTEQPLLALVALPACLTALATYGLYEQDEQRTDHSTVDEFPTLVTAITVGTFAFQLLVWAAGSHVPGGRWLLAFWATACLATTAGRTCVRSLVRRLAPHAERAVIAGAGGVSLLVARKLGQHPEYRIELVGFVGDTPPERLNGSEPPPLLGELGDLERIVEEHEIGRVIVAAGSESPERTLDLVRSLGALPVRVDVVPPLYALGPGLRLDSIEGIPILSLAVPTYGRVPLAAKRGIDIAGALTVLLLTAPFFAYAAWRIRRGSPGPVFFRQARLGKDARVITVLKFRTLRTDVDVGAHRAYMETTMRSADPPADNGLYKLDQRAAMTPFGRWLRRTSLDELPQLLNVLHGEMSLVGPRPCLDYELPLFAPHHYARFLVKPGMTGLWQVTARARATFREALDMDAAYATSWALRLDLRLLARTPLQLFRLKSTT
jgi:exopolysaccharide biosynthesis polyprenyl glycosylphosphotransferase